jgi:glycosyltransferase involved in cell wall biosynthesis
MKRRILAVIVLYKLAPQDSESYQSLLQSAARLSFEALDLRIVLYDNTPKSAEPHEFPSHVRYIASASNSGLATAYNLALQMALDQGYDWLLTLDQDTNLPFDTLALFLDALSEIDDHPYVAAVVPRIRASGRIVSPNYFVAGAWPRWFPSTFTGIPDKDVYAFNSGSLLRTAALRQVGGYSPWFWLDNSDSYIYRQLSKFGKRVYIAGALEVDHDFSMLNLQKRVSPERYRTILLSESAFWDLEMNELAGMERTAKLIGRFAKHLLRKDDPALRRLTTGAIRTRLFRTRRQRLADWRRSMEATRGPLPAPVDSSTRPKVSVCMASYNGERYVKAQLESILQQLERSDEVIVFDDNSADGAVAAIREVMQAWETRSDCPKITLALHKKHQGAASTFEDAIRSATGDIVFLSDDHDLWVAGRVHKVLDTFATQPQIKVVCTGFTSIDENDRPLDEHRKSTVGASRALLHKQFLGPTMAFRSSLIEVVLPFPRKRQVKHGAWIESRNMRAGGETAYIEQPLLLHRVRGSNGNSRLVSGRD